MRSKAGMKFDCILEETLDFIDIDYTHLNKTVRYEERPHGEWIPTDEMGYMVRCSECNFVTHDDVSEEYNFCPNCGADMREGDSN